MKRLDPVLGPIDHALATLACVLAVYSIGMSLHNAPLALAFTSGIMVAAISGYAVAKIVRGKKIANYDSYFWAVLGILAIGLVNSLNDILPGGGFPVELLAAAALCWILLIGSLFAWRDQTLLFLSLPCIAIFGLVGTFDTFAPATVLFFVFMLTIALLYARIHHRAMIERAKRAGIEEPDLLRRGAWKWMAGPEWALASALTIVIFSFMGAPVLRISLKDVAGKVQVTLPQQNQPTTPNTAAEEQYDVSVGTGPAALTNQQVFKVKMDRPRYLRLNSFSTYTGHGWKATRVSLPTDSPLQVHKAERLAASAGPHGGVLAWPGFDAPPQEPIEGGQVIPFTLKESNNVFASIIAPGPVVEVLGRASALTFLPQGWVVLESPLKSSERLTAYALVPTTGPDGHSATLPPDLKFTEPLYLSKDKVSSKVRDLAYRVTAGAVSDYDKAAAIERAIEERVVYNTNARKTPQSEDAVEYFLFQSHEGYCDLFASSMALMARSVGMPSRYVIGYIVNEPLRDDEGFFTVRARDYHAWCEIYFEGVGWVPFDPTEGAPSVDGSGVGALEGSEPFYRQGWFRNIIIGIVVVALAAPVYFMLRLRVQPGEHARVRTASEVARLHAAFYMAIERFVGAPKRFSQTTREYVHIVGPRLGSARILADDLVVEFESAMFSSNLPQQDKLASLASRIAAMRGALRLLRKERP